MSLSQREIDVLSTIIETHITTAAPVGSGAVAKSSRLRLSSASMRNIMSELTEKGFLSQPHTSAGRIPTPKAYRLYVDFVLQFSPPSPKNRKTVLQQLTEHGFEVDHILRKASGMVSSLSHQVAMVLAPEKNDVRWRRIDFSQLADKLVLVVLVLDGGMVRNRVVEVEHSVTTEELTVFSNYLNTHFTGLTLSEARTRIGRELKDTEIHLKKLCSHALHLARLAFTDMQEERELFVEGRVHVLEQAEFADTERLHSLLSLLEKRSRLLTLLDKTLQSNDVTITLGEESDQDCLGGYGMVAAPYGNDQGPLGVVSVIGPVRMDYAAVVPVVNCISQSLSTLLKHRFDA